jgi:methionine-gamma-lyase
MDIRRSGFSTKVVHAGQHPCRLTGALATPIYQTSTFSLDRLAETRYVYTRVGNPTNTVLEEKMAILESGERSLTFSSGMAAISATIFSLASKGDHIITDNVIYGCTYDLFSSMPRFGIEVSFVDASDVSKVEGCMKGNTKLIFLETPANPTMKISDIKAISEVSGEAKVVVDNTFMTPYFQRPLELGADIVVHSATKYIGGHGDTIGGVLVGNKEFIEGARSVLKDMGGAMSPFNAWLLIRGLKTLVIRMERHEKNALEVAVFLEDHPKVKRVLYPGLESHPQHELAKRQMGGFGGMLAFEVDRMKDVMKLMSGVELCTFAVSLGDVDTLIEHPASMTHRSMPKKYREDCGITGGLVRLSVGIEDVEDIIKDLKQALV